jgi:diguanylate cyclase (GGDEF)-like protein
MILIDPSAILLTSLIVGLMAMAMLALSRTVTPQVRAGVALWVAGDAIFSLGRLVLLLQPGVLSTGGLALLQPDVAALLNTTLVVAGAFLHTIALRAAFSDRANSPALLAAPALAALGYLGLAVLLPRTEVRVQLMLLCTGGCMLWTLTMAWPQRRQFRGAWLICGTMAFFLCCSLVAVVALALAPPGLTGREQLPPLPILMLDLTSALAMTMAFTLTQFERMQHRFEKLSVTDPLTGAYNRRGLVHQLDVLSAAARRADAPLSLAIFDLDHFKRINDTLGHQLGDAVLMGFVHRVQAGIRGTDVLGRWGGEEFLLLMPGTSSEDAMRIAERLREAVAASPMTLGVPVVTVSGGVTSLGSMPAKGELDEMISSADANLYRAKLRRNCVLAASDASTSARWIGSAEVLPA